MPTAMTTARARLPDASQYGARGVVLASCAAYLLLVLAGRPPGPLTTPDSAGYLASFPIHTLGYPVFLALVGSNGATLVQPAIFSCALAALGLETLAVTSSLPVALLAVAAAVAAPEIRSYHYTILTESLFLSGLVAFVAAASAFARHPSVLAGTRAAAIVALTSIVRRTGLALIPALAVAVLLVWGRHDRHRRWALALSVVLPLIVIVGGERIAAHAIHGDRISSLTGRHLFAKAALVDASADGEPAERGGLAGSLADELARSAAPIRELLRRAPGNARDVLRSYYETCLQGPCVRELGWSITGTEAPEMDDALADAAVRRVRRAPLAIVRLTIAEYVALWRPYKQSEPAVARSASAFAAANRPLPFEREAFKVAPEDPLVFRETTSAMAVDLGVAAAGWITGGLALLLVAAALSGRTPPAALVLAGIAALSAHAALLFTAALAASLARFLLGVWPAVAVALVLAAFAAWSRLASRSAAPSGPSAGS